MTNLTQLSIVAVLGTAFIVVFISFMVSLGNENNLTVETLYTTAFDDQTATVQSITYNISEAERGSIIDPTATDVAQLRGSITAEKEKLNFISVFENFINNLRRIFPLNPILIGAIFMILVLIAVAAIYNAVTGKIRL